MVDNMFNHIEELNEMKKLILVMIILSVIGCKDQEKRNKKFLLKIKKRNEALHQEEILSIKKSVVEYGLVDEIIYIKDTRTGICFAIRKTDCGTCCSFGMADVPCDKVEKFLINKE